MLKLKLPLVHFDYCLDGRMVICMSVVKEILGACPLNLEVTFSGRPFRGSKPVVFVGNDEGKFNGKTYYLYSKLRAELKASFGSPKRLYVSMRSLPLTNH